MFWKTSITPELARIFRTLDIYMAAEVLEGSDPNVQVELIQNLNHFTYSA